VRSEAALTASLQRRAWLDGAAAARRELAATRSAPSLSALVGAAQHGAGKKTASLTPAAAKKTADATPSFTNRLGAKLSQAVAAGAAEAGADAAAAAGTEGGAEGAEGAEGTAGGVTTGAAAAPTATAPVTTAVAAEVAGRSGEALPAQKVQLTERLLHASVRDLERMTSTLLHSAFHDCLQNPERKQLAEIPSRAL
jgi:hypothetical protein